MSGRERVKLDFSQFHALDHLPGSARCRRSYGGASHHWRMHWRYVTWPMLRSIMRKPWCWVGRHHRQDWFYYPNGLIDRSVKLCTPRCRDCRKKLPLD